MTGKFSVSEHAQNIFPICNRLLGQFLVTTFWYCDTQLFMQILELENNFEAGLNFENETVKDNRVNRLSTRLSNI